MRFRNLINSVIAFPCRFRGISSGPDREQQVGKQPGMVFQSFNLFGHKNIIENIIMPQMDLSGKDRNQAKKEALLQLRKVGLEEKAYNMPDAPSRLSKITPLPPLAYEVWLSVSVFENNPMFAESMPDFSKAVFISS